MDDTVKPAGYVEVEPKDKLVVMTKQVRRLSFYFDNGTAQDFNLNDDDTLEVYDEGFLIHRANGARETVFLRSLAWMRDQTITVKLREAK